MKSETAEFAMSQRTNNEGVPNADDWTSEGGVTFAFTNQLEPVSSQATVGIYTSCGFDQAPLELSRL